MNEDQKKSEETSQTDFIVKQFEKLLVPEDQPPYGVVPKQPNLAQLDGDDEQD